MEHAWDDIKRVESLYINGSELKSDFKIIICLINYRYKSSNESMIINYV